jgi:predicted RNase H-like nuclease
VIERRGSFFRSGPAASSRLRFGPSLRHHQERRQALGKYFPDLDAILSAGKKEGLLREDILDAAIAYWSALRLADGKGRSLIEPVPHDTTGLPMTIWV